MMALSRHLHHGCDILIQIGFAVQQRSLFEVIVDSSLYILNIFLHRFDQVFEFKLSLTAYVIV